MGFWCDTREMLHFQEKETLIIMLYILMNPFFLICFYLYWHEVMRFER
jgi:hypothetical protein